MAYWQKILTSHYLAAGFCCVLRRLQQQKYVQRIRAHAEQAGLARTQAFVRSARQASLKRTLVLRRAHLIVYITTHFA